MVFNNGFDKPSSKGSLRISISLNLGGFARPARNGRSRVHRHLRKVQRILTCPFVRFILSTSTSFQLAFIKESNNLPSERFRMLKLAFPDNQQPPSRITQPPLNPNVSLTVVFKFCPPEFQPRFWHTASGATLVPMPKTSMHENDFSPTIKH